MPARRPYLRTRDEDFASDKTDRVTAAMWCDGRSLINRYAEPAWNAVAVGRRLGYRGEDIAAYLWKNYSGEDPNGFPGYGRQTSRGRVY